MGLCKCWIDYKIIVFDQYTKVKKEREERMNLIGLDIGTTSICGVLYSKDKRTSLKVSTRNNEFISSDPGEYQQSPYEILSKIESILNELIDFSSDNISGISLSSQMHGILYVDEDGKAVSPFFTWQNQRGLKIVDDKKLETVLTQMLEYPVYSGYGIVTHYSLFMDNCIPSSSKYFCNIGDYVCMKLADNKIPVTDVTIANSMGICNLKTGKIAESLKVLGEDCLKYLPEISSSPRILGNYRGIPVIQPIGDNQASFLGSVKDKEKSLLLNYGTAGQISFYTRVYEKFSGFETRPLGNDEGYIHAAFSLCGGNSYKILSRFFSSIVDLVTDEHDFNVMKVMDNMDLDFSTNEIQCMPYFLGKRGEETQNAYFNNISEANFTPENIVKSLVQGMVDELYENYSNLPADMKDKIQILVGSGNGIRKNGHLIKAVELTYKKPLQLFNLSEESCLGAIIHAGKSLGLYKNYSEGSFDIVSYE